MSSFSGYVTYLKFTAGSNKGKVRIGDEFNSPFALKQTNNEDARYTSRSVKVDATLATGVTSISLKWTPITRGTVYMVNGTTHYVDNGNGGFLSFANVAQVVTTTNEEGLPVRAFFDANGDEITGTAASGIAVNYGRTRDAAKYDTNGFGAGDTRYPSGASLANEDVVGSITGLTAGQTYSVEYIYNNVYVPQNDIPLLNAEMAAIPLVAHARRIAVYYSNLAAFQAKTDYGFDMGQSLADQAVAQLSYEIDTEIVNGLHEAASTNDDAATVLPMLTFSKTLPIGVSMQEHFASFSNIIEKGKAVVYKRTKRFSPTYMVIAADIMPVLAFVPGFKAASTAGINGPYFAGTVGGLKVFVSPALEDGVFFFGVNGSDAQTSAAVYAPYMAIVPTQLLGFADGAMSQGFSTLYDFKILNPLLLAEGRVTE